MIPQEQFFAKFKFDRNKAGWVGIEREQFVIDPATGAIIPASQQYLQCISGFNGIVDVTRFNFGYELSACQLESKIGPCVLQEVSTSLHECEEILRSADRLLSLGRVNCELAPENMPLDIYPDPTGRYQTITKKMPTEVLSAACRVAATHIHIGMPDMNTAIEAYNNAISHVDGLIKAGDGSNGQRMLLYHTMARRSRPAPIASPSDLYEDAVRNGFVDDPRQCWTLIRISVHGTLEFRMFGATDSIESIDIWAHRCHQICT